MELLIIKSGHHYIRVLDNCYQRVGIDKASVFPVEHIELVRQHEATAAKQGCHDVCIRKLVMTEEEL